jgi:uncharacterized membrane protein
MITGKRSNILITVVMSIIIIALMLYPNQYSTTNKEKALRTEVVRVDNTNVEQYGMAKVGQQSVEVLIKNGKYKGSKVSGVNYLIGKMELDTVYDEGNTALVTPYVVDGNINSVTLVGIYRLNYELILLVIFALSLLLYAGWIGAKALVSFLFSGVMIWKILLPSFLSGYNPIIISVIVIIVLTAVIMFLIAGFTKKAVSALLGSVCGILVACILSIIFTDLFQISGAVKPFTETLLYSGYSNLNITHIFIAGIFMAASGAIMDIAMDVSSTIVEVAYHNPGVSKKKLILSGLRVGQSVIGTMTTTLLLAYSSSYMGLLMVFMAQGTPGMQILNLNYVASEILNTLIGSISLVLTAPLTAVVAGILYGGEEVLEENVNLESLNS